MKKTKLAAALLAAVMMFSLFTTAFAAEDAREVVDLGDGYYVISTVEFNAKTRSNTVYGSKTSDIYYKSTQIGSATLYGQFEISGSTVRATASGIDGYGMNGWSYDSGSSSRSGNTCNGSAKFKSGTTTKTLTISFSCSSNGTLT